jgi:alkylhydroperoxidase family enzyme
LAAPNQPRIAPLTSPYAANIQADFDAIMRGAPPLVLFRVMAKHERAWHKFRAGSLLDKGPLSLRQREIVIDRTCALNKCEYEWGVHIAIFAKAAELTDAQVRATVLGDAEARCWSEAEQALLRAVDALHHRATLSDDEFAALAALYDEAQIIEIIMLCGFYRTVSYLANGLKLPLEDNATRSQPDAAPEPCLLGVVISG